jgi:hypothetical protein
MHTRVNTLLFLVFVLMLMACGAARKPVAGALQAPDYSQLAYWAAHPAKQDPADSTPAPYKPLRQDTMVDVFFIHPTTYLSHAAVRRQPPVPQYWNASLADSQLNEKTDASTILNQASVFNTYRVFAPRYRQAHIHAFQLPDSLSAPLFDTAYADVRRAFQYYLDHQNGGRPFILAAHSQGTLHAGRLLREMIEGKALQQQLVAAYIVGLAVPHSYFSTLPVCNAPDATGCFVSWRTFKKGYVPDWVKREREPSYVVNPITWRTDSTWSVREQHRGAVLYRFNNPLSQNLSAGIYGNVLWSTKPRFTGSILLRRKNYHIGDINLFWKDIRDNAALRVQAYRNNSQDSPAQ